MTNLSFDYSYKHLFKYIFIATIIYFIMSLYFMLIGYKDEVPFYMEIGRFVINIYFVGMLLMTRTSIRPQKLFIFNALAITLIVLFMKYMFMIEDVGDFSVAIDSYTYLEKTLKYADLDFLSFVDRLIDDNLYRDDFGFFTVAYLFAKIYPSKYIIIYGVIALNGLCLYVSMKYLYKLQMMLTNNHRMSILTSVLYASSPFVIVTDMMGLKEIVFVTLVIMEFYFIYKAMLNKDKTCLLWALPFVFLCIYFRTAIFYMALIALILSLFSNLRYGKMLMYAIIIVFILGSTVLPYVIERFMGVSLDFIMSVADYRTSKAMKGQASYGQYVPLLAGLIGPFPNIDRSSLFAIMNSLSVYIKMALSFSFIMSIYIIVKKIEYKYIPMVFFIFFNVWMTIISGVSLDLRYHITYLPFFFIICSTFYKKHRFYDNIYLAVTVILVFLFSARN